MTTQSDAIGLTKAQGYADSLRQQARWIEEALDDATPQHQRVDIGDIDIDELNEAATQLDALSAAYACSSELLVEAEARADALQARVKKLKAEQEALVREIQRVNSQLADEMKRATRAEQERDKLQGMLLLCGELGGIGNDETPVAYLRRLIDGLIDARRERDEALDRLKKYQSTLKSLSNMYASTWDSVDGNLVMMGDGVTRFENAHAAAYKLLTDEGLGRVVAPRNGSRLASGPDKN